MARRGRKRKWEDPKAFEEAIYDYFDKRDAMTGQDAYYTVQSLAHHLGLASNKGLWEYEQREEYKWIVDWAKARITDQRIRNGISGKGNAQFLKFLLTNDDDYRDRQEIKQEGAPSVVIHTDKDTADALAEEE